MTHAVLARVIRSGFVEGVHHGSAVALDADSTVVAELGDPGAAIFPRSSNKPLQAVAFLRAGAPLEGPFLALAASSHSGERFHLDGVRQILASAGLDESALANTPDLPLDDDERLQWARLGRPPSALAQNCSGKHAAMLAACVENDWSVVDYLDPAHPLQRLVSETVADLAGEPVTATGVDGCGAPVLALSLVGLARAFARIASAAPGTPEGLVAQAIRLYPEWLGGTGRDVTMLVRGVPGLIAKDGAEGVYAAAMPDGRAAALKIADGSTRARPVVMAALLRKLGVDGDALGPAAQALVLGHGVPVGCVEAVEL